MNLSQVEDQPILHQYVSNFCESIIKNDTLRNLRKDCETILHFLNIHRAYNIYSTVDNQYSTIVYYYCSIIFSKDYRTLSF